MGKVGEDHLPEEPSRVTTVGPHHCSDCWTNVAHGPDGLQRVYEALATWRAKKDMDYQALSAATHNLTHARDSPAEASCAEDVETMEKEVDEAERVLAALGKADVWSH